MVQFIKHQIFGAMTVCTVVLSCSTSTFKGSSANVPKSTDNTSGPGTAGCAPDDKICFESNGAKCAPTDQTCITAGGNPQSSDTDPLSPTPTTPTTTSGGPGKGGAVQCDASGKKSIAWTGPAKTCIEDQKKMFNFSTGECMTMAQAKFECNWEKASAELEQRGLLTDKLRAGTTDGSILVSCGQSQDGNKIVVQWIRATAGNPAPECGASLSDQYITTGCYQQFGAGEALPDVSTPEKERAYVFGCLSTL